jgi:hypothetical protein
MNKNQLKKLIHEVLEENFQLESQASDDAKRQGLEYMQFGRWGKDGKVTHVTQGNKLVPRKPGGKKSPDLAAPHLFNRPKKSPEQQRDRNRPDSEHEAEYNVKKAQWSDYTPNPAHAQLMSKINNIWNDTQWGPKQGTELDNYNYYEDIPADVFLKATGLTRKAALWADKNFEPYEAPFTYDPDTDTFQKNDPMDT